MINWRTSALLAVMMMGLAAFYGLALGKYDEAAAFAFSSFGWISCALGDRILEAAQHYIKALEDELYGDYGQ